MARIFKFCESLHSKTGIAEYCGYANSKYFYKKYMRPLLAGRLLEMTDPGKPASRNQKYVSANS